MAHMAENSSPIRNETAPHPSWKSWKLYVLNLAAMDRVIIHICVCVCVLYKFTVLYNSVLFYDSQTRCQKQAHLYPPATFRAGLSGEFVWVYFQGFTDLMKSFSTLPNIHFDKDIFIIPKSLFSIKISLAHIYKSTKVDFGLFLKLTIFMTYNFIWDYNEMSVKETY